jgi:DNA modification methylase
MALKPYFEQDGITLYHGDCREVLRDLPPESVDMVLTDPPYLVSYTGRWGTDMEPIRGDSDPSWVAPVFVELWRLMKRDSLCLSFYGWPQADTFLHTWKLVGLRPVSLIVLVKIRWGFGHFTRAQHEQAYLLAKGHPKKPKCAPPDVLEWASIITQVHPNQKPLSPISRLVDAYTPIGGLVIDPFAGSGTTLVAARLQGRQAIGIEIEERFCEVAATRLSQSVLDFGPLHSAPLQQPLFETAQAYATRDAWSEGSRSSGPDDCPFQGLLSCSEAKPCCWTCGCVGAEQ